MQTGANHRHARFDPLVAGDIPALHVPGACIGPVGDDALKLRTHGLVEPRTQVGRDAVSHQAHHVYDAADAPCCCQPDPIPPGAERDRVIGERPTRPLEGRAVREGREHVEGLRSGCGITAPGRDHRQLDALRAQHVGLRDIARCERESHLVADHRSRPRVKLGGGYALQVRGAAVQGRRHRDGRLNPSLQLQQQVDGGHRVPRRGQHAGPRAGPGPEATGPRGIAARGQCGEGAARSRSNALGGLVRWRGRRRSDEDPDHHGDAQEPSDHGLILMARTSPGSSE